jgi:opacity protein-like surface antigen
MPSRQAVEFAEQRLDFSTPEERAAAAAAAASAAAAEAPDALAAPSDGIGSSGTMFGGEKQQHVDGASTDGNGSFGSRPLQFAKQDLLRTVRERAAALVRYGGPALVRSARAGGEAGRMPSSTPRTTVMRGGMRVGLGPRWIPGLPSHR